MTPAQTILLANIRAVEARFVGGSEVQVARALEKLGLVKLTDNGSMVILGRVDGERWWCEAVPLLTDEQVSAYLRFITASRAVVPGTMNDAECLCSLALRGDEIARAALRRSYDRNGVEQWRTK